MVTQFEITREIMYNIQVYFEKNPSVSYSKHNFITAPLERLTTKLNILRPFKWFFSTYVLSTPKRTNITQRAFKKLLVVSNVLYEETDQFKVFQEELKKRASGKPWYSQVYQGCLFLGERCIFDKSTTSVSTHDYQILKILIHLTIMINDSDEIFKISSRCCSDNK
jgi:hypothetical protein